MTERRDDGTAVAPRARAVRRVVLGAVLALGASAPAAAHDPASGGAATGHGLGFGAVVALTVALGVLGGAVVVRRRGPAAGHPSLPWAPLLLVALGCWAFVLAAMERPAVAVVAVGVGAAATWSLRNRTVGGHHGCEGVALGAVVFHRLVEGALLATLYAADAAIGVGASLVLGTHAAAETGAVAGIQPTGRWGWAIVGVVQAGFVAGALGGGQLAQFLAPWAAVAVPALVGGALVAAGVDTGTRRRRATARPSSP